MRLGLQQNLSLLRRKTERASVCCNGAGMPCSRGIQTSLPELPEILAGSRTIAGITLSMRNVVHWKPTDVGLPLADDRIVQWGGQSVHWRENGPNSLSDSGIPLLRSGNHEEIFQISAAEFDEFRGWTGHVASIQPSAMSSLLVWGLRSLIRMLVFPFAQRT